MDTSSFNSLYRSVMEMDQMIKANSALDTQVGGEHYKNMRIQPVEYNHRNGIPFIEGCVIKYLSRWRSKNGIEDLKKAQHFLQLLIEMEEQDEATSL